MLFYLKKKVCLILSAQKPTKSVPDRDMFYWFLHHRGLVISHIMNRCEQPGFAGTDVFFPPYNTARSVGLPWCSVAGVLVTNHSKSLSPIGWLWLALLLYLVQLQQRGFPLVWGCSGNMLTQLGLAWHSLRRSTWTHGNPLCMCVYLIRHDSHLSFLTALCPQLEAFNSGNWHWTPG